MSTRYTSCRHGTRFSPRSAARQADYRGRPVVVGADPKEGRLGRRKSRLVRGPLFAFIRRCRYRSLSPLPDAVFPPRFERYQELSDMVMKVMGTFTPLSQPSSDEAFLDCSGKRGCRETGGARDEN